MQLVEKHRPKTLEEVIGQEKVIEGLRRLMGRKDYDRGAITLEGPTGTGKTTIARALAAGLGCDQWTIEEIDGDRCSVERVRRIHDTIGLGAWGLGGWRVYIVNEAHAMTGRAVQAWLTLLEDLPARRLVIFTTTRDSRRLFGEFSGPFIDRTISYRLTKIGLAEKFAKQAYRIAKAEGLNGRPFKDYLQLMGECHNSMRAALQRIERGDMLAPPEHTPAIKKMMRAGKRPRTRKARTAGKPRTAGKAQGRTGKGAKR